MNSSITSSTYIRNLSYSVRRKLSDFLDPQDSWKGVIVAIQKPNGEPRYSQHHVRRFEALAAQGRSPTVELLSDWGTTNCTVGELVDILRSQKLLAPASILLPDTMKLCTPEERPTSHPAVAVDDIATRVLCETVEQPPVLSPDRQPEAAPQHTETAFSRFSYHDLVKMTGNFDDRPMSEGGRRLGEGGFGIVYKGVIKDTPVAVKKLNVVEDISLEELRVQFHQEIQTLELLKHENLVDMIGFSCESHYPCLVYAYMANGSLLDRLACMDDKPPLKWQRRCMIAVGTARGLEYLHSNHHIHRDVKSANILLDEHLVAKISDFGLTRASAKQSSTTMMTERIVGTRAYMAPEALRGEITPKSDIFSFGVVLLEILSGLPPVDESREPQLLMDLRYDIDDEDEDLTLEEFLDRKMGGWELCQVESTYTLACNCLQDRKVKRPAMTQVLSELEDVVKHISPEHEAQESEA